MRLVWGKKKEKGPDELEVGKMSPGEEKITAHSPNSKSVGFQSFLIFFKTFLCITLFSHGNIPVK